MSAPFNFELVSPEKLLFSKAVVMVTVPGSKGEYGVLAGHAPMITEIKPGVIKICEENDSVVTSKLFVAGGFAEVTQTRFTVLAGEVIPVSELDIVALNAQAKELASKIAAAANDADRDALLAQQAIIAAKIQAAA